MVAANNRLTIYPLAFLIAIAIGIVFGSQTADSRNEWYGGDFPAFYGAGAIAAAGDWDELYELDRQIEAQSSLPSEEHGDSARYYAYPPQVAFVYQPLAQMSYLPAYLTHTLIMSMLLAASLWLARPMIPWLQRYLPLGMAAAMVFWPMFRAVTGGSNGALTLFLIIAGWRLVHDDQPLLGGMVFAMLLYKPQFAFPLVGLFLLRRAWSVVGGATVGGVLFFLTGALLRGWGWVGEWIDVASEFGRIDVEVNGHSAISFVGFTENLFGVGLSLPTAIAWLLVVGCIGLMSWLWWTGSETSLDLLMAVTVPGLLLISPHTMSHDGALIVVTAAVAAAHWAMPRWRPWVVVLWAIGATLPGIKLYGFSPGVAMLVIAMYWGWLLVAEEKQERESRQPVGSVS